MLVEYVSQAISGVDAFGLDTDSEWWGPLVFQPLPIAWALVVEERLARPGSTSAAPIPDPSDGVLDLA